MKRQPKSKYLVMDAEQVVYRAGNVTEAIAFLIGRGSGEIYHCLCTAADWEKTVAKGGAK